MRFSRLLAVAAALALSPTATFAMPIQCDSVCPESYDCNEVCGEGYRLTTCGKAGYACVSPVSAPESGDAELVSACSDCSDTRNSCLGGATSAGDVQACVDNYVGCAESSCGGVQ